MGTICTATSDPRIKNIKFQVVGDLGNGSVPGDVVPEGKIWLIESAGMFTDEQEPREWMLQIQINNPGGTGGLWLCPLHRNNGSAWGTPILALSRRVVLIHNQTFRARCNGLSPDRYMGLMYTGWELDECWLPYLLGLPPLGD